MDCCYHALDRIVKEYRDTVGRPDPYCYTGKLADERIVSFQVRPRQARLIYDSDPVSVHLMPLDDRIRQGRVPPCSEGLRSLSK